MARIPYLDAADLSHLLGDDAQPTRLRGTLHSAPTVQAAQIDVLRSLPSKPATRFVLRVRHDQELASRTWRDVSGLVQVTVVGDKRDITVGDQVELLGRLAPPAQPRNPGEFDYAEFLRDQGSTTTLVVLAASDITVI